MTTRQYSSRSQQSTLTAAITSGATSMTVVSGTALLGGVTIPAGRTFTLVIDVDTAIEEIVDATAVSTNTFTITRAIDGSSAQDHSAGAVVRHMAIGRDYRDANLHAEASASYNDGSGNAHTMHGIAAGEGDVVGTAKTQTLTNKTLTAPTISDPVITGVIGGAGITFEGSTADAHETTLTVQDPTQDNTITLPNTTGTVVIADATQTLTNKTLTSPTISGSPVITGLSSAGMVASSAAPKDYVDSILGSATAAATSAASAATSATSAATSASSASTSASSALTSANSASTSASSALTSANSAATSATAAATSATSSATSATAAATSATSAATSASSASTSASSALTSANSASTSASSALTSANSAATSASSAATSYDDFDDRYLGAKASPPTLDNDGNALLTGALYWNTGSNQMFVWGGSAWAEISSTAQIFRFKYTAAGGETSESGVDDNGNTLSYLVGKEQVYLNGALLVRGSDYTATNGTSIASLSPALSAGDVLEVITFSAFVLATAITNSSLEAKGDLISASTAGTLARVAVGSNDQVLVADSATTSGLAWKSYGAQFVAGKNKIINGDFSVNQRQFTSVTTNGAYGFDRWRIQTEGDGSCTYTPQLFTLGTAPVAGYENKNYAQLLIASQTSASARTIFAQRIESVRTFAGQTVTYSFWAKAATGTPKIYIEPQQQFGSGGTPSAANTQVGQQITLSTSWQRYSTTFTVDSIAGKTIGTNNDDYFNVQMWVSAGSDYNARTNSLGIQNNTFDIWGVQLEAGNVATPFQTATGTLQGELAACQRYYYHTSGTAAYYAMAQGVSDSTTGAKALFQWPVTLRTASTDITYGNLYFEQYDGTAGVNPTVTAANASNNVARLSMTGMTGLTAGRVGYLFSNNSSTSYIAVNAEL
jgi:hypothetical protein